MVVGAMMRLGVGGAGASYSAKVLSYSPIAYWPLWEASGGVAECLVNAAQNGAYTGVTLGQTGIGDGNTCPLFDGLTDFVDVYTTTFRDAFNGEEGSFIIWAKVFAASVWTDGNHRRPLSWSGGLSDYIFLRKTTSNNRLLFYYYAGGAGESYNHTISSTVWFSIAMTWSKVGDYVRYYIDGSAVGTPDATLGTWGGTLQSSDTVIGANNNTANQPWYGWLAHAAVWDTPLTPAQIADLATV